MSFQYLSFPRNVIANSIGVFYTYLLSACINDNFKSKERRTSSLAMIPLNFSFIELFKDVPLSLTSRFP